MQMISGAQSTVAGARPVRIAPFTARSRTQPRVSALPEKNSSNKDWADVSLKIVTSAFVASSFLVGFQGPSIANEIASLADNPLEAVEKKAEDAVKGAEEAITGPSAYRASAPVGAEGKVTNLADKGLEGGAQFQEATSKLKGNAEAQYEKGTEVDKEIQKESEFKAAAKFKENSPGSAKGNSVLDGVKNQISGSGSEKPQPPSASFFGLGGK